MAEREMSKRHQARARLAIWEGIRACRKNACVKDNPFTFDRKDLRSYGTLLWCRWLLGWIQEHNRNGRKQ